MSTKEEIRHAQLAGAASRLRATVWRDSRSDRQTRHRDEWPELWEVIDRIAELAGATTEPLPGLFGPR